MLQSFFSIHTKMKKKLYKTVFFAVLILFLLLYIYFVAPSRNIL